MAKSKGKKSVSTGVPKKVAGVKVPKAVRESKSLGTLLTSGLGREILADALIAAAAAAAAALTKTRPAQNAGHAIAETGSGAAGVVQTAAGAVAGVVTEAAKSFLPPALVGETGSGTTRAAAKGSQTSSRKRSKKSDDGEKGEGKKRSRKKVD